MRALIVATADAGNVAVTMRRPGMRTWIEPPAALIASRIACMFASGVLATTITCTWRTPLTSLAHLAFGVVDAETAFCRSLATLSFFCLTVAAAAGSDTSVPLIAVAMAVSKATPRRNRRRRSISTVKPVKGCFMIAPRVRTCVQRL